MPQFTALLSEDRLWIELGGGCQGSGHGPRDDEATMRFTGDQIAPPQKCHIARIAITVETPNVDFRFVMGDVCQGIVYVGQAHLDGSLQRSPTRIRKAPGRHRTLWDVDHELPELL